MSVAVIQHTTNGGTNWINQFTTPTGHNPGKLYFSSYNKGWAGASDGYFIFITTNGGQVWCRQATPIYRTGNIFFEDSLNGWCYSSQIAHTTNGGGIIFQIANNKEQMANTYKLNQNYPNPFNSETEIKFSLPKSSIVSLTVFDILGRELIKLINSQEYSSGNFKYALNLNNYNLSSGVYLYKMDTYSKSENYIFTSVKKLIYNK